MNSFLFVFLGAFLYTWYYGGRILFLKAYDIHQILQVLFTKLVKSVSEKWSITNRKTLLNLKINENTNDCFYCVSIKKLASRVLELMIDYNTSYCNFKWCEFDRVWKYGAVHKLNNLRINGHLLLIFVLFIFISYVIVTLIHINVYLFNWLISINSLKTLTAMKDKYVCQRYFLMRHTTKVLAPLILFIGYSLIKRAKKTMLLIIYYQGFEK